MRPKYGTASIFCDPESNLVSARDRAIAPSATTAFVDQNQTYTSHPSHQVFLRQYGLNGDGVPVATGKLIEGGGASPGGMATWGEVKAQALLLGIQLTDFDVGSVPLLRTDQYGNFIPDATTGFAQVITGVGVDGIPNTADDVVVSGTPSSPVNPTTAGAIRTNEADPPARQLDGQIVECRHSGVTLGEAIDAEEGSIVHDARESARSSAPVTAGHRASRTRIGGRSNQRSRNPPRASAR